MLEGEKNPMENHEEGVIQTLVDWKNQTIDFETVIAQLKEFGIEYSEL